MVPLLAPLIGSLAGSLLPATFGSAVAGALGLSGTAAGLVAAAAPKAIGAGIGTLLAGGDMGEAALNAVGFGAGSALLGGAGGAAAGDAASGAVASSPIPPRPTDFIQAAPSVTPAAAPAMPMRDMLEMAGKAQNLLGGGQQQDRPIMPAPQPVQRGGTRVQENPMLAGLSAPPPSIGMTSMGGGAMPASMGIGSIPMGGQSPMSSANMFAGMGPDQQRMVGDYLRNQGMVGFA